VALILSLLAMAVIMALAVLIAWLLFRNAPEVDPGPVIPDPSGTTTVTVTPTTPPPGTGSPTTGPASPRPSGTTPSPGGTITGPFSTNSPGDPQTPTNPGDRF
jgi:hypothetical protein